MTMPGILHQLTGTGNPHLDRLEEMFGVGIEPAMELVGKEFKEVSNAPVISWVDKAVHVFGLFLLSVVALVAFIVMCAMRNDLKNKLSSRLVDSPSLEERSPAISTPPSVETKISVVEDRVHSEEMERLIQFTQEICPREITYLDREFGDLEVGDIVVIKTTFCIKQYAVVIDIGGIDRGTAFVEFMSQIPTYMPISRLTNYPIGTSGFSGIVDPSTLSLDSTEEEPVI